MAKITDNSAKIDALIEKAKALPEAADLSGVTAEAADVRTGKTFVNTNGNPVDGTMADVAVPVPSVSVSSSGLITSTAEQPAGYTPGGTKTQTTQLLTKAAETITPTKSEQVAVNPSYYTTGQIKVAAIPSQYQDVSNVTSTAAGTLAGTSFVDSSGTLVPGTMPNNGAVSLTMDGIDTKSVDIAAGYTSGGTVSLTDDIDNEVAEQAELIALIKTALEGKAGNGSSDDGITLGTCSVTVNASGLASDIKIYSVYKQSTGSLTFGLVDETTNTDSHTTEGLPCSAVVVVGMNVSTWNCTISNMTSIGSGYIDGAYKHVFVAPVNDGVVGTLTFSEGSTYGSSEAIKTCSLELDFSDYCDSFTIERYFVVKNGEIVRANEFNENSCFYVPIEVNSGETTLQGVVVGTTFIVTIDISNFNSWAYVSGTGTNGAIYSDSGDIWWTDEGTKRTYFYIVEPTPGDDYARFRIYDES